MPISWARIFAEIREHAESTPRHEVCGLILNDGSTVRCQNCSVEPWHRFTISASVISRHAQNILGVYHSHINFLAYPTYRDLADWNLPGALYAICSVLGGKAGDVLVFRCGTMPVSGHRFAIAEQPQIAEAAV